MPTPVTLLPDRLQRLSGLPILNGSHTNPEDGLCVMEAVAWVAGEPHSDHPKCVSPVIGAFLRSWNDSIIDTATRTRLMAPLVPLVAGTANGKELEDRRAWACIDWMVRVCTPTWLDACHERYAKHTAALRALPEITEVQSLINATPILVDLRKEAAAAWDAAWAAAWDAAWAAAGAAAWDAAGAAAWDAAGAAARDAAGAAARDAAGDRLKPQVEQLQASATELVKRLCAMGTEAST